jgi:hypothetical protein
VEDLKKAEESAGKEKKKQDSLKSSGGGNKPPEKKGLLGSLQKLQSKGEEVKKEEATHADLVRILNNYNALYEQRNPGKITYFFVGAPTWIPLERPKTNGERMEEDRAKQESLFAKRTSTASPELASAKDNIPVKKETFAAKMQRIKSDGNKIGVLLHIRPVRVPKPDGNMANSSTFGESLPIEGEYMDESLKAAGPQIVKSLIRHLTQPTLS